MNKIIASAGLVALGTAGLHGADPYFGLTRTEASKPWSVSAALRGFYDDNYNTAPSRWADDSFGFEFSPAVKYNLPREQTYLGLGYIYSLKYFEARPDDEFDHSHQADLKLEHRFNERYKVRVENSFVYAQEPEVIDSGGTITAPIRADYSAYRNRGGITFTGQFTERFGSEVGYENGFYDYTDDGPGSISASLDRLEHSVHADARFTVRPSLITLIGYQLGIFDYTSEDYLFAPPNFVGDPTGDIRDGMTHTIYVGAENQFTSKFSGSARIGAQYADFDDLNQSDWSPYLNLMASYMYRPGSSARVGFRYAMNATDIAGTFGNDLDNITTDSQTGTLYASLTHQITAKLIGNLLAQYQFSEFQNGFYDGDVDNLFLLGLNLEYRINQYFSTEIGYNFDRLDSDIPARSFSRNRVYAGVRASY